MGCQDEARAPNLHRPHFYTQGEETIQDLDLKRK
jgi:hypothetical protein